MESNWLDLIHALDDAQARDTLIRALTLLSHRVPAEVFNQAVLEALPRPQAPRKCL